MFQTDHPLWFDDLVRALILDLLLLFGNFVSPRHERQSKTARLDFERKLSFVGYEISLANKNKVMWITDIQTEHPVLSKINVARHLR